MEDFNTLLAMVQAGEISEDEFFARTRKMETQSVTTHHAYNCDKLVDERRKSLDAEETERTSNGYN